MRDEVTWKSTEQLAFTTHDGPVRPRPGPRPLVGGLMVGILAIVFTTMILSDSLCPEHRAWVQGLGTLALVGCVATCIALVRSSALAPMLAAATTSVGVFIGTIDAQHDATRGWIIAAAFGAVLVGALWLGAQQLQHLGWSRAERVAMAVPRIDVAVSQPSITTPVPDRAERTERSSSAAGPERDRATTETR